MNRSIANSASWLTATKFINLAISMVTVMLLSRFRTLNEYGTYSQLMMIGSLGTTIFMMGLSGSVNYFLSRAKDKNEQGKFLSTFFTISTIISIVSGIIMLIISPGLVNYFNNPMIMTFVYFLAILPWFNITSGNVDNIFVIFDKIKTLAFYRITYSISTLGVVVSAELLNWSFARFMLIYTGIQLIFTIAVYLIVGNLSEKFRPRLDKKLVVEIFSFSIPLGLAYTVGTLHIQTDQLMIGYLYNTETLAIYTNASREMPITIVVSSIIAVITPPVVRYMKNNQREKAVELWKNATILSYSLLCFFAGILFVYAPQIISILYSNKYLGGVSIFRISSVKILLQVTNYAILLIALGRSKLVFLASIISLILNFILSFLFYFLFGLNGFAIATLISTALSSLLQLYYSSNEAKISLKYIFPWKDIIIITLINTIFCIVTALINIILIHYINSYFSIAITISIVSLLYMFFMKKKVMNTWTYLNSKEIQQ